VNYLKIKKNNTFAQFMKQILFIIAVLINLNAIAQSAEIRGFLYEKAGGEPMIFTNVQIKGTSIGAQTDINGFFSIPKLEAGQYNLFVDVVGYDSLLVVIDLSAKETRNVQLYLQKAEINLQDVVISGKKDEKKSEIQVSTIKISQKEIKKLPSAGGVADVAQYLQVVPGVVSTGDQGGQLYIRGGSPVQNRILLDGMTIYSPFHSIGFFSVFETDIIKNVEVNTGGFPANMGGRISAIVDITSRDGNKKRTAGNITLSPFMSKAVVEGPLVKLKENSTGSLTYIIAAKKAYIDKTSTIFYPWAKSKVKTGFSYDDAGNKIDKFEEYKGLPFNFTDLYAKMNYTSTNGSKLNLFGFRFEDNVNYQNRADIGWTNTGGGINFVVVPGKMKLVIDGGLYASKFHSQLKKKDDVYPSTSDVGNFNFNVNFNYYIPNGVLKYGIEGGGNNTNFEFFNTSNSGTGNVLINKIEDQQFTTEFSGFVTLKKTYKKLIIEPGLRAQYYASLGEFSIEPRFSAKLNMHKNFRLKLAAGMYSQNLISAADERQVVNLFNGYLQAPESELMNKKNESKLQKSIQLIGGVEIDITDNLELSIEPYQKVFTQLINLAINKKLATDGDFQREDGNAFGVDFLAKYNKKNWYIWLGYSWSKILFRDGSAYYASYNPNFDRRHNINFLLSNKFGKSKDWEASVRFNFGTGFPFTQIAGNYPEIDFTYGGEIDYTTTNPNMGTIYSKIRNGGRLPDYARLDASLKKEIGLSENTKLEIIASVTNVANRNNIFYFDAERKSRINQLPILPSLALVFNF
jgi:hypothetical protein